MSKKFVENNYPSLTTEEREEITHIFELFDTENKGKINPSELREAMLSLAFDVRNPIIYNTVCELENLDANKKGGVDLNAFLTAINKTLGAKDTEEGMRRLFQIFNEDTRSQEITIEDLKRIGLQIENSTMSKEEINEMMLKAERSGNNLTFEEFQKMMTKKSVL